MSVKPLRIAYVLADTAIAGGIRVAVAQGDALIERGHSVTMFTSAQPLTWRASRADWKFVASVEVADFSSFHFVVGTFWNTLPPVYRLAGSRAIHLCQGYEGSFTAYQSIKAEIDATYRLPIPKITVSPRLVPICRQFVDDATYIGQIVDDEFFQPRRATENPRPRVLMVGPAQADVKGVDIGYEAVQRARTGGADFALIRASQWEQADDEPAHLADEFHIALDTAGMARLVASCDIVLATSRHQEGFGLPAAEAMAGGLAAVLSSIPSYLSWDPGHDFALFAVEGDAESTAVELHRLVSDASLRDRLASRGREVVEQFRHDHTAARLERYFDERRHRAFPRPGSDRRGGS